jgi:NAD+ synthase
MFHLAVNVPGGRRIVAPLPARQFRTIIAAQHTRQRIRMSYLYYHAEARDFAVLSALDCGAYHNGLFAKFGENGADVLPLAHLYAGQIRTLAEYLGVPREILDAQPSSEQAMEYLLGAVDQGIPPEAAAEAAGIPVEDVLHAYRDILHKRQATDYSRTGPLMLDQAQRSGLSPSSSSPV